MGAHGPQGGIGEYHEGGHARLPGQLEPQVLQLLQLVRVQILFLDGLQLRRVLRRQLHHRGALQVGPADRAGAAALAAGALAEVF